MRIENKKYIHVYLRDSADQATHVPRRIHGFLNRSFIC